MCKKIFNEIKVVLFIAGMSVLPGMFVNAAEVSFDDINFPKHRFLIPKTPEANCANSVIQDLKLRLEAMRIPFVESGELLNGKGSFYYPRDTNAKDAHGRIIVPNKMTVMHGSPPINAINFKDILDRTERFFTVARPKTYSCVSHLRQLPMNQLLCRYCDALGAGLAFELGIDMRCPTSRLSEEHFYLAIGMHDGGNSLILQNMNKQRRLLVGEAEVIYNLMFLRRRGFFGNERLKNFHFSHQQSARMEQLLGGKSLEQWLEAKSAVVLEDLSEANRESWYHITHQLGFNASKKKGIEGDVIIGKFLAQKAFVSEILLPLDFSVQPDEVVILPQIFYHLDLYMAPTSIGKVLLPDFNQVAISFRELAQKMRGEQQAKAAAVLEKICDETENLIKSYNVADKLIEAKVILEQAGFAVATAPIMALADNKRLISALNPIYGINPLTSNPYWFVSGISLGAKTEEILASKRIMTFWKDLMLEEIFGGSIIEFDFLGARTVSNEGDSFEDCRLLHEKWAGIHCLTADIR